MTVPAPGATALLRAGLARIADDPVRVLGLATLALAADVSAIVGVAASLPASPTLADGLAAAGWLVGVRAGVHALARAALFAVLLRGAGRRPALTVALVGVVEALTGAAATGVAVALLAALAGASAGALALFAALGLVPTAFLVAALAGVTASWILRAIALGPVLSLAAGPSPTPSLATRLGVIVGADLVGLVGALLVLPAVLAWPLAAAALVAALPAPETA
jgi:hypothetical protein